MACTGIVLAGGASRRMGQDKAFLELGGQPLIGIVASRLGQVCTEVLLVAGDVTPYRGMGLKLVADRFKNIGVLGGIQAGLEAANHDVIFVVGCDMPLLSIPLLRAFISWIRGYDAAVLRRGRFVEPLHAAYHKSCLPAVEKAISEGRRRVISFFPDVRVRYIAEAEAARIDPQLWSFNNANTPGEWRRIQAEWERLHPAECGNEAATSG